MITFDKIREIERAERESKKLQPLPENFIDEVKEYIKHKELTQTTHMDILELKNIKSTIKHIFTLREKKILDLALFHIETGMPVENMDQREKFLFNRVVDLIKKFREDLSLEMKKEPEKKTYYVVKKDLPEFVGPDMKTYRFEKGQKLEESDLPKPLNELLLREKIIERE